MKRQKKTKGRKAPVKKSETANKNCWIWNFSGE